MNRSSSNSFWLGIDLAQDAFDAALAPISTTLPDWRQLPCCSFSADAPGLTQLARWLKENLPGNGRLDGICLESTGGLSRRFAQQLAAAAPALPETSIVNPKRPLDFGRSLGLRDKTDRIDAAVLALYGATVQPPKTAPLDETQRQLRDLVRLRDTLVRQRDGSDNRWRESDTPFARKLLERRARQLKQDIHKLEQEAQRLIQSHAPTCRDYRLLLSIKGIGPITARIILAELGDLRRFTRNQLIAYVGLYPRLHQSGKNSWRKPGLAKGGNAIVRKALFNGARSLLNSKDNTLKDYADRLQQRGERPMYCLVATMRKMLLVARAVVRSGHPYNPEFAT